MNKFPDKIFAYAGGGLGDIYYFCFNGWSYFKDIKKKYPNTKIHVVYSSPNPKSKELLEDNPFIDEVQFVAPKDRRGIPLTAFRKPGYALFRKISKSGLKKSREIYLSEEDKEQVAKIKKDLGNKYIIIHPFTNDALKTVEPGQRESRYVFPVEEYFPLVEKLIEEGYKVGILGGNSRNPYLLREEFTHQIPGVVDLIDKLNARTAMKIIADSDGWIGTYSCFVGVAWWAGVKSFLLAPNGTWRKNIKWKQRIETWERWAWATKEPQNKILYLPKLGGEITCDYEKVRQEVLDWFKT